MNVKSTEKREKSTMQLVVEISPEEFEDALNKAYKKRKSGIMVPGFRKGKAPRKIIESMYGAEIFYEDAVNEIYPEAYDFAVKDQDIKAVGRPTIEDVDFGEDKTVTLKFVAGIYPDLKLGEYKGVKAVKSKVEVTEADVAKELETARSKNARISSVERAAKDGDTAVIDFEGFLDGKPFEGGKGESYSLVLGSGSFVPGFEEQVVGMKAGEEKDIDITFPKDYHEDLAGKAVVFKVKVNEVKESVLPELDDEFAKDVSDVDTLAEYKEQIKKELLNNRENDSQNAFEEAALTAVIDGLEGDVPDSMVEEQAERMAEEFRYNLANQGLKYEDYLSMMGVDHAKFIQNLSPNAMRKIKAEIALEKIVEAEKLDVTEEEIDSECKKQAETYGMELDKFKEITGEYMKKDMLLKKAAEFIRDNAVAVDELPAEEAAEEKKPAKKPAAKKTAKKADAETEAEGEEKKPAKKASSKKADAEKKEESKDAE